MSRVVLHIDRRKRYVTFVMYVLVIDGVPYASGERDSMLDLIYELENCDESRLQ